MWSFALPKCIVQLVLLGCKLVIGSFPHKGHELNSCSRDRMCEFCFWENLYPIPVSASIADGVQRKRIVSTVKFFLEVS